MMQMTHERESGRRTTLRLEGSLGAEWVGILERECTRLLHAGVAVKPDLSAVDFVERLGVQTLRRLARGGVEIHCRRSALARVLEAEGVPVTITPAADARRNGHIHGT